MLMKKQLGLPKALMFPASLVRVGFFLLLWLPLHHCLAQQPTDSSTLSAAQIDHIVKTFTLKETQFRQALNLYSFKRDALLQSFGMGGQLSGEYHRVSYFTFDDKGARYEKISHFPMSTFEGTVTDEDLEDLGGVNPFALEPSMLNRYNFNYVGKEKIDELNLYVFDVSPKVMPDPKKKERLFAGRVWVDDHELQIVKTRGKGVPETKTNKFPTVETYREEIDGKYWFPTYSYADEELVFENGSSLHLRMKVTYSNFAPARATVTITEAEGPLPPQAQPTATPQPATTPENNQPPGMIQGGILNSKAIELPEPVYTEEARKAGARGRVIVAVVVNEEGKVIDAEIEDGPIQFRRYALEAARKARFKPMLVAGQPVKVSGVLEYRFAP